MSDKYFEVKISKEHSHLMDEFISFIKTKGYGVGFKIEAKTIQKKTCPNCGEKIT